MTKRLYGVSTHLFHGQRLNRNHLLEIAAQGFDTVELFATRTHFDYHNPAAIADLQQWLAEAGLVLHGIHAPVIQAFEGNRWVGPLSLASSDEAARGRAVAETEHALHIARRIPVNVLVMHVGYPKTEAAGQPPDSRAAARRSIEALVSTASALGVKLVVEVIPNEMSRPGSLVHFIEEDLEDLDIGICLDFGHAHMAGDVVDAIETVSEHLVTTHVHDNRGRADEHLVPFDGTIDWPAALTSVQKIGYDGTMLFEVAAHGTPKDTLVRTRGAREKMKQLLAQ